MHGCAPGEDEFAEHSFATSHCGFEQGGAVGEGVGFEFLHIVGEGHFGEREAAAEGIVADMAHILRDVYILERLTIDECEGSDVGDGIGKVYPT